MPISTVYSGQGPRLTVNSMIADPLMIRARLLQMADQQFIMEALLRPVPSTPSGAIVFSESTPLFASDDATDVAEGGEIPLGVGQDGLPRVAHTTKTGLGIEITREMRDRNRTDLVNLRLDQVRNTLVRNWERKLFAAFSGLTPAVTINAANPWASSTTIRNDIGGAVKGITTAVTPNSDPNNNQDYIGFVPDTLVIPFASQYDIMLNTSFTSLYLGGDIAERNPQYTFQLERNVMNLQVLMSRFLPAGTAYVLQSKVCGGWSDERPLGVTPLYPDQPREVWRADVVRRTGIFIDQPLSVAKIVGI
jgi:hypothetical protein